MRLVKRTYVLPPATLRDFEGAVGAGERSAVIAQLLQDWLDRCRREQLRQAIIEGCREMTEVYREVEREYHPLEEEVRHALESESRRGEVVRVRLDPVEGAEQGGTRPALVVSPDVINEHCPVILIASITSKKTGRVYPFEVLIEPPEGGLTPRLKVLLMHLRSVDQRRPVGSYGQVSEETMRRVDEALKVATDLTPT